VASFVRLRLLMKILHVFDYSIPLHSGYTFRSRAILNNQRLHGLETLHLTSSKHKVPVFNESEEVDGLHFFRTPDGILSKVPLLNQLDVVLGLIPVMTRLVKEFRPNVIHAHSPCLTGVAALRVGRTLGIPVVYECRAFWEDAAVDQGKSKENDLRYRLTRRIESYVFKNADAVFCISQGLKDDIASRGFPVKRLNMAPNAVDLAQFDLIGDRDAELEAKLGLAGKKVIGFIGSFYAYEGVDLVIKAMPSILKVVPNAVLMLVGGGIEEMNLKALVGSLKLDHCVQFIGRVPHSEVSKYASLVDAFVFARTSIRLTNLVTPLKPLEAMAQGRLVVASDVGGHKELIANGSTGYLFRADDPAALTETVCNALLNEKKAAEIIANGRKFVEDVRSWEAVSARYLPVYNELVSANLAKR
jgi:PEP-CTERM/exosortase A-associated glycosyltransferase